MINVVISEDFMHIKKSEYVRFVEQLGNNVCFSEDKWVCDNLRRSPAESTNRFTLYFNQLPEQHREIVKYFSAIRIIFGISIASEKAEVTHLTRFFNFWADNYKAAGLHKCDAFVAVKFFQYLEKSGIAESTCKYTWKLIGTFFKTMNSWHGKPLKNPFLISPFYEQRKFDGKYISESVAVKLDNVFKNEEIALHTRCIYWLLRLIPSRIGEILGMRIDCLKRFDGHYVLFIPTWKQNGGWQEPIMRSIHLEEAGIAGYLIGIIKQQQDSSRQLQEYLPDNKKDALLTYVQRREFKGKLLYYTGQYRVSTHDSVDYGFQKICVNHNIMDSNGKICKITTHQFRHNGITDRLAAGFTAAQIAEITGHHGSAMIFNSYNHLNLMPETIIKKQEYVSKESDSRENRYILFGGRILNMEEQLEKRLLRNLRAHKVRGGICSDITGCKSDMWNCLDCEFFVADAEQLGYYEEQAILWREKSVKFNDFPIIKGNAERNAELYERILKKLKEEEYSL